MVWEGEERVKVAEMLLLPVISGDSPHHNSPENASMSVSHHKSEELKLGCHQESTQFMFFG